LRYTRVAYPPLNEQKAIGNFLDQRTGQIDELTRIKERQVELLREQRTALINQVVTKGLDPNAEMKPSGVEWIGEIPKDQEVTRLKYICELIVDCEHKTAPTQETGYPLIRTPNIGIGHLILDGVNRVSEAIYREWSRRTIPQSGDLILAREAPVGNVAIIPTDLKVCLGQRTVLIRPDKNKVYAMFLVYLMLGDATQVKLLGHSTGAIVHHLNMTDIRNLELPRLPSLPIQHKIANFLDRKTGQIDELIATEQRKIELLKEYRQSLISEAVTGKIDVRNEI
jgi:type I restriction enzyme S subunit